MNPALRSWPRGVLVAGVLALAAGCSSNEAPPATAPGTTPSFQRLTGTPVAESSPEFAPDGVRVAYERGDGIWVLDVTTRAASRVAPRGNHPTWSADGASLLFVRRDLDGGGPLHRLIRLHLASGAVDTVSADSVDAYEPAAAPIGDAVALRVLSRVDTRQTLRVLAGDGDDRAILTPAGSWVDMSPAWSADGAWIAFVRLDDAGSTRLMRVAASGEVDATPLSGAGAGLSGPAWHADGRIVFSRAGVISVIASSGGPSAELVRGNGFALAPTISPDGRRLVFATDRSGNFELWQLFDPAGLGRGPYLF
ncbi:MAG: hypothetical protein ABIP29_00420 [Candidatus Eisenbacteria bacterium]